MHSPLIEASGMLISPCPPILTKRRSIPIRHSPWISHIFQPIYLIRRRAILIIEALWVLGGIEQPFTVSDIAIHNSWSSITGKDELKLLLIWSDILFRIWTGILTRTILTKLMIFPLILTQMILVWNKRNFQKSISSDSSSLSAIIRNGEYSALNLKANALRFRR